MSSPTPPPSCEDSSGGDATPKKRPRTSLMRYDSDASGATNVVEQEHRDKKRSIQIDFWADYLDLDSKNRLPNSKIDSETTPHQGFSKGARSGTRARQQERFRGLHCVVHGTVRRGQDDDRVRTRGVPCHQSKCTTQVVY